MRERVMNYSYTRKTYPGTSSNYMNVRLVRVGKSSPKKRPIPSCLPTLTIQAFTSNVQLRCSVKMKALYPTSNEIPKLSEAALALKIARHSLCLICSVHICLGLRLPPIVQLVLDSVEDYDGSESYLSSCSSGHNWSMRPIES